MTAGPGRRRVQPSPEATTSEDGFTLLEAVVSISLLVIIVGALGMFSVTAINTTSYQRQRQAAVQVANSVLATARAMPAASLPTGRTPVLTNDQFDNAPPAVKPWLLPMNPLSDSSGASTAQFPMSSTTTINNTGYTATNYLGSCFASATATTGNACGTTAAADAVTYTRVVVAVTWPGSRCAANLCSLVTATLISPRSDPTFSTQQQPPTGPVVTDPGNQVSWLHQDVSLQLAVDTGTGVDPESWTATGLPAGLSISPAGLVTGNPTALGTSPVTVTATDAFLRSASRTFTWTVVNPVSGLATPFTTTAGATITAQALPWNCPTGSCTYTLTGAPPGIGLSTTSGGTPKPSVTVSKGTGTMYLVGSTTAAAAPAGTAYASAVAADSPTNYWPLNERSGTTGADAAGSSPLTHRAGVSPGTSGAVLANANAAATYDGTTSGFSSTTAAAPGPQTFSVSLWFRTKTASGGKLIGFGDAASSDSVAYDRHLYLDDAGHVLFGVYPGTVKTVSSAAASTVNYADGAWHQAVGTLSGAGMVLYVDGVQVARDASATSAQAFSGYWRIGGDNLDNWPNRPTSRYVDGSIDEVSVHSIALSATQVKALYQAGTATPYTLSIASTQTTPGTPPTTVSGDPLTSQWTVNPPPSVGGVPSPFTATAGAALTPQQLTYSCASRSCSFTATGLPAGVGLATTATGSPGATATASTTSGTLYLVGTPAASSAPGLATYPTVVANQGAGDLWRLGERAGTTGADSGPGQLPLTHASGVTPGTAGAIPTNADAGATYDGTPNGYSSTTTSITAPQVFSESLWFRTKTSVGGRLFGFGNSATGTSGKYDRHLYMDNAGHLTFGVYNGGANLITSSGSYNDDTWHQAVATMSTAGMALYVDGVQLGTNANSAGEPNTGFWRVGGDNLSGTWTPAHTSTFFKGQIDDVAVYPTALSAAQVTAQWAAATTTSSPYAPAVSTVDTTTSVTGSGTGGAWTVSAPSTVGGLVAVTTLRGSTVNQLITWGCPTGACTLTLAGAPAGVGLASTDAPGSTGTGTLTVTGGTGVISLRGTVSGSAATYQLTLTPSDTATGAAGTAAAATWVVGAPPTVSGVKDPLATKQGATIPEQALAYECPSRACTLTVSGAPAGVGLASASGGAVGPSLAVTAPNGTVYLRGTVSPMAGTGQYPVVVTPTDTTAGADGTTSTGTWSVGAGPSVNGVKDLTITAGAMVSPAQPLAYSCPSSSCTLTLSNAPAGVGLFTDQTTGSASASLPVTSPSGTVYLRGTVSSSAAAKTYPVTVTPTDTATPAATGVPNTATWTVNAPPSVSGLPGSDRATKGQLKSYGPLQYTCPSGQCTLAITSGAGAGLGLSSTASGSTAPSITVPGPNGTYYLRGTVTGTAGTTYPITVTPTDTTGGVTGTANTVNLKVDQPKVSGLKDLTTTQNATITSQALAYDCPSGSCSITVTGVPSSIGLNKTDAGTPQASVTVSSLSGTIYLRGQIPANAPSSYTVSVTATDTLNGVNLAGPATTATWTVQPAPAVTGPSGSYSFARNTTVTGTFAYSCPTASCTITITGAPSGMGISTSSNGPFTASVTVSGSTSGSLYLKGSVGSTATTYAIAITPVDNTTGAVGTADTLSITAT